MGGDPCPTVCEGDVILKNQAAVDAFCGCEVIAGDLFIGNSEINATDISSLTNLKDLRKIGGSLIITETILNNLEGLEKLEHIEIDLAIGRNSNLENLRGLNNLNHIGKKLSFGDNPKLADLNALSKLKEVNSLILDGESIEDLSVFSNLSVTNLEVLSITTCNQLRNLNGLAHILRIESPSDNLGELILAGNALLEDISALANLEVASLLVIDGNPLLSDCCSIAHLIDEDSSNGQILNEIILNNNPSFCNSIEEILANCRDASFSCDNINVTFVNNELSIQGLTAPIEIVKVFDEDWQMVYDCFGDCEDNITLPNLSDNIWRVQIANYDEDWNFLCHGDQDVNVAEDRRSNDFQADDFSLYPNPAYDAVFIDLKRVAALSVDLKIVNQFGQAVYQKSIGKVSTPKQKIDLTGFSNGLYFLQIKPEGKRPITKKIMVSNLY